MDFLLLGPLEVRRGGAAVALGGPRQRALLALLVLHAEAPVSAERLALGLWGEDAPAAAVKTVQVYVARLRAALAEPGVLETTAAGYRLNAGRTDAERFAALAADGRLALAAGHPERAARLLRGALALWRGPPLAGLTLEGFGAGEVARLEEQRLAAVELRVEADLAAGAHPELIGELGRLASEHPLRERLHGQLMLALYRSGRQADALDAYRRARERLVELGLEPGAPLRELQRAILAHDPALQPPASVAAPPVRVPRAPTPTVGRDAEVSALVALLREPRTRIATLVGPGGVGKTRVAIEAARALGSDFRDGVWFVSLAALGAPEPVLATVVRALEIDPLRGEAAPAALARHLRARTLLLVLDNFEHVLAAAPGVAELVTEAEGVTVLATSREPLRLRAERVVRIAPLAAPDAVALFAAASRASGQPLGEDALGPVQAICARLDGLPLAIELAAGWTGVLTLAELAERLERALPLLVGGARDQPERQRTLRATIEWSHRLLDAGEQRALARFAAFPAGATVAAAEAVTRAPLEVLHALVAKHLLTRGQERLGMLATVREFLSEELDARPDAEETRERMADWMLALARRSIPHLKRRDRAPWAAALARELPNLVAALTWALERDRPGLALALAGELGVYARETGGWPEGLPYVQAALELRGDAPPGVRAKALLARARFVSRRDGMRYTADLERALALFDAAGDDAGAAICLAHLAVVAMWNGRAAEASVIAGDAVARARASGDDAALATAVTERTVAEPGYERAAHHAEAAMAVLEPMGDLPGMALACSVTGYKALVELQLDAARRWLETGLDAARRSAQPFAIAHVNGNLGLARLLAGDLAGAGEALDDALAIAHTTGADYLAIEALHGVAAVAAERGRLETAARLEGAADANDPTEVLAPIELQVKTLLSERYLAPARARLGPAEWDRERRAGAGLDLPAAVALARARAL